MARRLIFALVLLLVGALPLAAQEQTSSIQGTVTDQSGAALPGVTVEAVSSKGVRLTAQTDAAGKYRFPSVQPGTYTVSAALTGMEPVSVRNLEARLGESPKVDLAMKVGVVTEAVTVTADAPLVDVTSSAAATSIRAETFEQLPRGRDFSTVVIQAPSANQIGRAGGISIDGASGSENRYIMDGVDTTNPQTGIQGKTLVTNFVEEVQVKSSGYAAEFGGSTGGVINVITKTGTNEFKGSVGGYYNDRSWGGEARPTLQLGLGANSTKFEQFTPRKDDNKLFEPSVTLGGPIQRDHLWFYAGYEPWLQSITRTVDFLNTNGTVRTTRSFEQDFVRNNWVGNLAGSVSSRFLYKATYNNSGYETTNLLPSTTGRGSENSDYSPDDEFENWTGSGYADFIASPEWFFSARGGRFYRNYSQTGISKETRITFSAGSPQLFPEVPANLHQSAGYSNIPTNSATQKDAYTRDNLNLDVSWFPQLAGTHRFKAGVQMDNIGNDAVSGYQNYLVETHWNATCGQCATRGKYGSAGVYIIQNTGDVVSKNLGFFVQDSWTTMNDRLTLNIGVRTEQERVPAYNVGTGQEITGKYAINFDYQDKLAPRLGFSYDVFGNGRSKAFGSYGTFYDITKMEMPRGSFGGDKWIFWAFSLDDYDWTKWLTGCTGVENVRSARPSCPGMTLQGGSDLRHPSNLAEHPLVDPNLKPMETREFTLGFQQELTSRSAFGFRYVNKRLIRAIEDVGVRVFGEGGIESEDFFIANPGFGVAQKILSATCPSCPTVPKAKREYNGYELEFTKRFGQNWSAHASYVYSTLRGNYSGLANSDESAASGNARTSPNVNRIFDSLFMLYDQNGDVVEGPLGGDIPHQFKAQVNYSFRFGTNIGVNQYFSSGTPSTTEMRFQSAPLFAFNRNDIGRTPNITQTDLTLTHDFRIRGFSVQVGAIVLNLFDEKKATNYYPIWSTTSLLLRDLSACGTGPVTVAACGPASATPVIGGSAASAARNAAQAAAFFQGFDVVRQRERQVALGLVPDPRYTQPNAYQDPREVRIFTRFVF
jgi:hypothetical protein